MCFLSQTLSIPSATRENRNKPKEEEKCTDKSRFKVSDSEAMGTSSSYTCATSRVMHTPKRQEEDRTRLLCQVLQKGCPRETEQVAGKTGAAKDRILSIFWAQRDQGEEREEHEE